MSNRISSFPPIISNDAKILILGSVPGVKSLEMQEYYAHPQNKFWKIIFELFNENFSEDYLEKIKILKKNNSVILTSEHIRLMKKILQFIYQVTILLV